VYELTAYLIFVQRKWHPCLWVDAAPDCGTWFDKGGKGEQRLDFILGSMPGYNSPTVQSLDLGCKQTRAKCFWFRSQKLQIIAADAGQ